MVYTHTNLNVQTVYVVHNPLCFLSKLISFVTVRLFHSTYWYDKGSYIGAESNYMHDFDKDTANPVVVNYNFYT